MKDTILEFSSKRSFIHGGNLEWQHFYIPQNETVISLTSQRMCNYKIRNTANFPYDTKMYRFFQTIWKCNVTLSKTLLVILVFFLHKFSEYYKIQNLHICSEIVNDIEKKLLELVLGTLPNFCVLFLHRFQYFEAQTFIHISALKLSMMLKKDWSLL